MKPLVVGAVLALLWLTCGMSLATPFGGAANLAQPVTVAFAAGLYARPHLTRWKWTR